MHASTDHATDHAAEALDLSRKMLGIYRETGTASDLSLARAWARVADAFLDAAGLATEVVA